MPATDVAFHRCHRRGFHVSVNFRFSATSCLHTHTRTTCLLVHVCVCVCVLDSLCLGSALLCPAGGRLSMTSCIIMSSNSLRYRVPSRFIPPLQRFELLLRLPSGHTNPFVRMSFAIQVWIYCTIFLVEHIDMSQILPRANATRPTL